jgi:hypothetical protein
VEGRPFLALEAVIFGVTFIGPYIQVVILGSVKRLAMIFEWSGLARGLGMERRYPHRCGG